MPDLSGPFDNGNTYQAGWFRDAGYWQPSGVAGLPAAAGAGELGLTAAGFDLTLTLGRAHVRGARYERTSTAWSHTVPANTSATGPRRDLIVLRRDLVAMKVEPARVQGTPAATPADPALTQVEDGVWEYPLFRVQAPANSGTPLTITDLRRWILADDVAVAVAIGGGWNAVAANPLRTYLTNQGRNARLVGHFSNAADFTPSAIHHPLTVPEGYRLRTPQAFAIPFLTPSAASAGLVHSTLLADGRLRFDKTISGPTPIPAGSVFYTDGLAPWHLSYVP